MFEIEQRPPGEARDDPGLPAAENAPEPPSLNLPIQDLRHCQCRWPTVIDADDVQRFCGLPVKPRGVRASSRSYCTEHAARHLGERPN
ncbi:MAG TPA: hypothetical protein VIE66_09365 [Methylocella sp.]|jgi:hypothetical protein